MILDAGVLIAAERDERRWVTLLRLAQDDDLRLLVPSAVLAQVWRTGGARQTKLARAVSQVTIEPLTATRAKRAGELCASAGSNDVVDASIAALAEEYNVDLVTTDPADLQAFATQARGGWRVRDF